MAVAEPMAGNWSEIFGPLSLSPKTGGGMSKNEKTDGHGLESGTEMKSPSSLRISQSCGNIGSMNDMLVVNWATDGVFPSSFMVLYSLLLIVSTVSIDGPDNGEDW
jgi:hypothetical protein